MQTLEFKLQIKTTPENLWNCLWEPENYKKWTNVFCPGSYYKTDNFTQGSKIHLLTPNGDGMYSIIDKIIENKILIFKHIGELKNFEEQPLEKSNQPWTNAYESYEIKSIANAVELNIKVDTIEQYIDFMNKTFPLALQELKILSEK